MIKGINKDEFINSAIYQQLIRENIEPQIDFDYLPYEINNVCLGIFRIIQSDNQPYLMKKDYGKLKKGAGFIRKGDAQFPLERGDLDKIYAKIINNNYFTGRIHIFFSNSDQDKEITLSTARDIELPSEREGKRLKGLIDKETDRQLSTAMLDPDRNIFGTGISQAFVSLEDHRRLSQLERDLKLVKENYVDDDLYEFYELRSHKINITIINEGDEYIEDASLQIDIDKKVGLIILDKIYYKPDHSYNRFNIEGKLVDFRYPRVEDMGAFIRIHNNKRLITGWNIKHKIAEEAFWEPVRFLFLRCLAGDVIWLNYKLFGKNLKKPIEGNLKIKVASYSDV